MIPRDYGCDYYARIMHIDGGETVEQKVQPAESAWLECISGKCVVKGRGDEWKSTRILLPGENYKLMPKGTYQIQALDMSRVMHVGTAVDQCLRFIDDGED